MFDHRVDEFEVVGAAPFRRAAADVPAAVLGVGVGDDEALFFGQGVIAGQRLHPHAAAPVLGCKATIRGTWPEGRFGGW